MLQNICMCVIPRVNLIIFCCCHSRGWGKPWRWCARISEHLKFGSPAPWFYGTSLARSGLGMRLFELWKIWTSISFLVKIEQFRTLQFVQKFRNKITDTAQSINNWAVSNSSSMVVSILEFVQFGTLHR